jgi:hypothetical protein
MAENEVVGFDEVMRNLNREIEGIKDRSRDGLLEAGIQIQAVSDKRVPVEYGNLRGSSYTRFTPEDPNVVEVGYGAAYAPFVHSFTREELRGRRRPSGLGTYWNPGRSRFLQSSVEDNLFKIVDIVRARGAVQS